MMDRRAFLSGVCAVYLGAGAAFAETQFVPTSARHLVVANGIGTDGRFIEVWEGDVLLQSTTVEGNKQEAAPVALREGAYGRLVDAAVLLIAQTPGVSARDIPCQDYGHDMIAVMVGPETIEYVSANCPENEVLAAQEVFMDLLQAEILE